MNKLYLQPDVCSFITASMIVIHVLQMIVTVTPSLLLSQMVPIPSPVLGHYIVCCVVVVDTCCCLHKQVVCVGDGVPPPLVDTRVCPFTWDEEGIEPSANSNESAQPAPAYTTISCMLYFFMSIIPLIFVSNQ